MSDELKLSLARAIHGTPHATRASFSPSTWAGVERAWAWIVDAYVARIKRHPSFQNLTDAGEEYVRGLAEQAASDFFTHAKNASPNDTTVFVVDQPKDEPKHWLIDSGKGHGWVSIGFVNDCNCGDCMIARAVHDTINQPKEPTVKQETKPMQAIPGTSMVCRHCMCRWKRHADGTFSLYNSKYKPCRRCDNAPDFLDAMRYEMPDDEPPTPPWTEAQREAARDVARAVEDAEARIVDDGTPHVDSRCVDRTLAAIAKVAPMFVAQPMDAQDEPAPSPAVSNPLYVDDNGLLCVRTGGTQPPPGSDSAPSPAPAGVPGITECVDAFDDAYGGAYKNIVNATPGIRAVRDLFVRTRDERIAHLEAEVKYVDEVSEMWRKRAFREQADRLVSGSKSDTERMALESKLEAAQATIATLTKERDETKDLAATIIGVKDNEIQRIAADRDAALARVAELEKREILALTPDESPNPDEQRKRLAVHDGSIIGAFLSLAGPGVGATQATLRAMGEELERLEKHGAVDVEACAKEIMQEWLPRGDQRMEMLVSVATIIRKHSRDVRRITREEFDRVCTAIRETAMFETRDRIIAGFRAIGFEVEA